MRWQLKARVQNAVAALPFGSSAVYFAIQRSVGGLRPNRNHPMDRFRAALGMVDWIESTGTNIAGRKFLEIGTGHMANVPTALWLLGAGETLSVDLNRYLSDKLVAESNDYVRRNRDEVLALFGDRASNDEFQNRFSQLLSFRGRLDGLLEMMGVRYIAPCDARALPVPDNSYDFHVSNTVLEHIPKQALLEILAEAKRVMKPEGLMVHHIDPSDHFSHDDDSIAAVNFLRFSDEEWHRWAGNRFMYQNRLRFSEYIALFEQAGLEMMRVEKQVDERSVRELRGGLAIAEKFAGLEAEELATTEISVMARFKQGSHWPPPS